MTLVAICYHYSHNLPVVLEFSTYEKFPMFCEVNQLDWAYLMNKETGEILHTWRKDTLIVSQPTSTISHEQSINRVER
jgi:hypothetical protein